MVYTGTVLLNIIQKLEILNLVNAYTDRELMAVRGSIADCRKCPLFDFYLLFITVVCKLKLESLCLCCGLVNGKKM